MLPKDGGVSFLVRRSPCNVSSLLFWCCIRTTVAPTISLILIVIERGFCRNNNMLWYNNIINIILEFRYQQGHAYSVFSQHTQPTPLHHKQLKVAGRLNLTVVTREKFFNWKSKTVTSGTFPPT
jgi:hypothetical protein